MAADRQVRFSIQVPGSDDPGAWTAAARRAEDTGFSSISVPDHLGPSLPQLAPLVSLAFAAACTTDLRLAVTVLDNDFRHPVMLAKEIATLDLLSGGRVDMGIGAGWLEEDYTRTGVATWDRAGIRIDRLEESIGLLRPLLRGETVDHAGTHYHVDGFRSFPAAVQSPVPLLIGCRERRMVGLAAREAQIVNLLPAALDGLTPLEIFEEQLRWIDEAGGSDRDDLTIGVRVAFGAVAGPGESGREVAEQLAVRTGQSVDDLLASPYAVAGDLDMVRDQLETLIDRYGVTYFTVSEGLAWPLADLVGELST